MQNDQEEVHQEDEDDLVNDGVDFHWLTDQLAVGACFPIERASNLADVHGIGAVIDLREEDCDDEERLRTAGIDFLHLPTTDQMSPADAMLERGVDFAQGHMTRGNRVLIHCQGGIGRSALLALCVLVELGFEPLDALAHAKDCRKAVSPSHDQYQGWARWLQRRGKAVPSYHEFGCIAYRHLAGE